MAEVGRVSSLRLLRKVNLRRNPVCELPDYRLAAIFNVPQILELDGLQVAAEDKVDFYNFSFSYDLYLTISFFALRR